jgi:hypothetical protein
MKEREEEAIESRFAAGSFWPSSETTTFLTHPNVSTDTLQIRTFQHTLFAKPNLRHFTAIRTDVRVRRGGGKGARRKVERVELGSGEAVGP